MDPTIFNGRRQQHGPSYARTEEELARAATAELADDCDFAGELDDEDIPTGTAGSTNSESAEQQPPVDSDTANDALLLMITDGARLDLDCDVNLSSQVLLDFLADDSRFGRPDNDGKTDSERVGRAGSSHRSVADLLSDVNDAAWDTL